MSSGNIRYTLAWAALAAVLTYPVSSAAAGACGNPPLSPVCQSWVCIGPGEWELYPRPAGTSCNQGMGYCNGIGSCVYRGADIYPKFQVQSILYSPPGKQSEVAYGAGSSAGSRVETTSTNSAGVAIQGTLFGLSTSSSYSASMTNGRALSISKSDTLVTGMANAGLQDAPDRGDDTFFIWTNAKMTHYSGGNAPEMINWSTSDGGQVSIKTYLVK
jgi:hypothetical protein